MPEDFEDPQPAGRQSSLQSADVPVVQRPADRLIYEVAIGKGRKGKEEGEAEFKACTMGQDKGYCVREINSHTLSLTRSART